ncbi:MAG: hypothetical protein PHQ05_00495 [Sterolibacterium sp.]|nr:hypothetical protein [Sterolibacterium sp.]
MNSIGKGLPAGVGWIGAATLALLLISPLAQAEPLGRLFFTPERRAVLERQRLLNIEEKTQETIEIASVHVNGVVRRSNGKATVWVNGRPQRDDESGTGVSVRSSAKEPARVEIRVGEEPPTSLRIGERLNRATQEKTDGLAGGQLQVNRDDAAKPSRR